VHIERNIIEGFSSQSIEQFIVITGTSDMIIRNNTFIDFSYSAPAAFEFFVLNGCALEGTHDIIFEDNNLIGRGDGEEQ